MSPDANEKLTRRILGGLGVRPVGHQAPNADDPGKATTTATAAPPVPSPAAAPAAPSVPAQRANRLPDWWKPNKPDVDAGPQVPVTDDDAEVGDGDGEDESGESDTEEGEPVQKGGPTSNGPVSKESTDPKRSAVRQVAESAADDRTARVIIFNLSAGGVGYVAGLVPLFGSFLPAAEHGATGMFELLIAAAGAYGAWWVTRFPAVRAVFKEKTPMLRVAAIAVAATVGSGLAPVPVAWLNAHGEKFGLGPSAISLLLTAGSMCGGLWWLIDRRTRAWHWTARWLFRIPLASALLATALYAPGI